MKTAEEIRLEEAKSKVKLWKRWGPYLSERQWGTVREDYSEDGAAWDYFTHDHSRSRTYRWGEDGIAGISDHYQNLCFCLSLWNGNDTIIKERLYGLSGPIGNHGEDCKELYYYLDNTPTHSYMKYLYKYPHARYPYSELKHVNLSRTKEDPEFEILDTGVFDDDKYFDVFVEYAKDGPFDYAIKINAHNRGAEAADLTILPTLWFRNLWSFGIDLDKPSIEKIEGLVGYSGVKATHHRIGEYYLYFQTPEQTLFTENETNMERIFNTPNSSPFVKDAFHKAVIENDFEIFENKTSGTKLSPLYQRSISGGGKAEVKLMLTQTPAESNPFGTSFETLFELRIKEADLFYDKFIPKVVTPDLKNVQRQAFAGMLWTKQYYNYDVKRWLEGDPLQPVPPVARKKGRNRNWTTLRNEDIISMPDKWEYPWYAAWDLAFHCVPLSMIDPEFAKKQLIVIMREWYMAPNGQIPAYEWAFGDVNPPVQAWAAITIFETEKKLYGRGDVKFLKRIFQKLMINFTWWVNRKDAKGKNVFEGGFLGLDNIGVFDRSSELPGGGTLEQADGTSWMAMYSLNMMKIAIKICEYDSSFEDVATKFFEHFVYISESLNKSDDWIGAWDEEEGFYYDVLRLPGKKFIRLKIHSLVGLSPLYAVSLIPKETLKDIPGFTKRLKWFVNNRADKSKFLAIQDYKEGEDILFSLIPKDRMIKLIEAIIDESEFLAPGGIRSLSKRHTQEYCIDIEGGQYCINYQPGESTTAMFGGNSNWRGPVWMPVNYLLIDSLREYHLHYGDSLKLEYPKGSGVELNLGEIATEITKRLVSMFTLDVDGDRPVNDAHPIYQTEHFKDLVLFYEYFHGDNSRGIGASHQTGWTGIVAKLISKNR
jgi:hypothetical protein